MLGIEIYIDEVSFGPDLKSGFDARRQKSRCCCDEAEGSNSNIVVH